MARSKLKAASGTRSSERVHAAAMKELAAPRWRAGLRRRLLAWFSRHARDLPWRRSRDPYRVWVSEIMLQQTVVAAVVPYFTRFVGRFPSIDALANADEADVLRLWEGLGYYRRARQLHRAAVIVRDEYAGCFPRDIAAVRRLPGVGRYTAGAILSIAFDDPHPILEANTARLLARLLAFDGDTGSTHGQKLLWSAAAMLLPRRASGAFNQALMELGSQVCTPRNPRCHDCPLAMICPTRRWQLAERIPARRAKPIVEQVREAAVVVRRGKRVLLVRREPGQRWAGLWDFPRFPLGQSDEALVRQALIDSVARHTGWTIDPGRLLTTIRHSVTRFRISLDCYEAACIASAGGRPSGCTTKWVLPKQLDDFPLSTSARKLARLVAENGLSVVVRGALTGGPADGGC
jgi:A/G-specific adenine glycosylase